MRLELIEGKLSRSVPRGLGGSNPTWLLGGKGSRGFACPTLPCADRALSLPNWGAYTRHLDPEVHSSGKRNTQKIAHST